MRTDDCDTRRLGGSCNCFAATRSYTPAKVIQRGIART